ncbi:MAG TPA: SDR family oxidoreductase [Planctomycetota bacterium]|nr:SDR family oxidoreductase [Planctomycetota bacterium]
MANARIVVVGGLSGIGRAVVEALGPERCTVWSRRTGVDATDEAQVARAAAEVLREGAPWGLVHTVGDFDERAALDTDLGAMRAMLDSNLTTAVLVTRALVPAMVEARGGRVVLFGAAGLGGQSAFRRAPAYYAAKAALLTWMRALAADLAPSGVTVNMISPGLIRHATSHAASQERMAGRVPAGRVGEPRDILGAVRFLLSAESAYVTGTNLDVDGGLALV